MGAATDEIDRQIKETRDHIDENLGALEQRAASNARHYRRIGAIVLGAAAVGAGVLVYRRWRRPNRREQLQSMLVQALKELPDSLRAGAKEVSTTLKKPLPSVKVIVNGEADVAREPGTIQRIVRRVAPAVMGTASSALVHRFARPSGSDESPGRSTIPAYD